MAAYVTITVHVSCPGVSLVKDKTECRWYLIALVLSVICLLPSLVSILLSRYQLSAVYALLAGILV